MSPKALYIKNATRWLAANAVPWVLLSGIYSLTVAILLQTVLERLQGAQPALISIWMLSMAILLIPGALEHLPLPELPRLRPAKRLFRERIWSNLGGGSLLPLYLSHEFRRPQTWLTVLITVTLGSLLTDDRIRLFVFVAQLPLQRALWSIGGWRRIALRSPDGTALGASALIASYAVSQFLQLGIALVALATVRLSSGESLSLLVEIIPACLSGVLCTAAVAMEGDSGRPWIVNFAGLSTGIIGAALGLWQPALLLISMYIYFNLKGTVKNRLWSVENFDEDALLS
jgi:hypothetical protein